MMEQPAKRAAGGEARLQSDGGHTVRSPSTSGKQSLALLYNVWCMREQERDWEYAQQWSQLMRAIEAHLSESGYKPAEPEGDHNGESSPRTSSRSPS